jgi:hypothetical protein
MEEKMGMGRCEGEREMWNGRLSPDLLAYATSCGTIIEIWGGLLVLGHSSGAVSIFEFN